MLFARKPVYKSFIEGTEVPYSFSSEGIRGQVKAVLISQKHYTLKEAQKFINDRLPDAEIKPSTLLQCPNYIFVLKEVDIADREVVTVPSSIEGIQYMIAL